MVPSSRRLDPAKVHLVVLWSGSVHGYQAVPVTDIHGMPGSVYQLLCPFLATTPWSWGSIWCPPLLSVLHERELGSLVVAFWEWQCVCLGSTSWPITHNSPATAMYCLYFSNCPVVIAFLTSTSSSSTVEASSISRVVNTVGVAFTATNLKYSSADCWWLLGLTSLRRSRDSGSAMFSCPGLCTTLKSYGCNLRTHRSIREHGLDREPYITSKG